MILAGCITLLGCFAKPAHGFGVVLWHSPPMGVHKAQAEFAVCITLRGGLAEPTERLGKVFGNSQAVSVKVAEPPLLLGLSRLCSVADCIDVGRVGSSRELRCTAK